MSVGADIQLNHTHARIFPPGKTFTAPWHSDLAHVLGIDLGHSLNFFVKVHYFFEDLRPDQGCLAFLPGSHRLPADTPRPRIENIDDSAVVTKIVPRAGDVILFNTHVLHMALDNTSPAPRKSLIYAYSHFWLKNYTNAVPTDLEKYATTPLRAQMFGIEAEGVPYFNQRYDANGTSNGSASFLTAGSTVLRRIRRATSSVLRAG
jgi:ectoine hydroxylase-related dioxygenase (phytanoyl-CoA dioxygenase family)